jgi:hypothetical protein
MKTSRVEVEAEYDGKDEGKFVRATEGRIVEGRRVGEMDGRILRDGRGDGERKVVGAVDGRRDGSGDGLLLGAGDGRVVRGARVGRLVRRIVGDLVELTRVGESVTSCGVGDSETEGSEVGRAVGGNDGEDEGKRVGGDGTFSG